MIARVWKDWTSRENADPYENLLKETILPAFKRIEGYCGGTIYRKDNSQNEVEFMINSFFNSLEAVKDFAGQKDYSIAVIEPKAEVLLKRAESRVKHYEIAGKIKV